VKMLDFYYFGSWIKTFVAGGSGLDFIII